MEERNFVADLPAMYSELVPEGVESLDLTNPEEEALAVCGDIIDDIMGKDDISRRLHPKISREQLNGYVEGTMPIDPGQMLRGGAEIEKYYLEKELVLKIAIDDFRKITDYYTELRDWPDSKGPDTYVRQASAIEPLEGIPLQAIELPSSNLSLSVRAQDVEVADAVTASPGYALNKEHVHKEHDAAKEEGCSM